MVGLLRLLLLRPTEAIMTIPFYERPRYVWTCAGIVVAIFLISWVLLP